MSGRSATRIAPEEAKIVVRVLVAIEPRMYREVLAFHIRQQRPGVEVGLASGNTLRGEADRTRPHLIIASESSPLEFEGEMGALLFWIELGTDNSLVATISADGDSDTIHDVSLHDFIAVVDKTKEQLAHG